MGWGIEIQSTRAKALKTQKIRDSQSQRGAHFGDTEPRQTKVCE